MTKALEGQESDRWNLLLLPAQPVLINLNSLGWLSDGHDLKNSRLPSVQRSLSRMTEAREGRESDRWNLLLHLTQPVSRVAGVPRA
ncbi:hypothetical protein ABZX51_001088 [Aspergillus tubingensis]